MLCHQLGGFHDSLIGWSPAPVSTVMVVDVLRPVEGKADEKAIPFEEFAPVVVEEEAVGLETVSDRLTGSPVLLLKSDRLLEELQTHQRRFASLPAKRNLRFPGLHDLADKLLKHLEAHSMDFPLWIQRPFLQVEAVFAGHVAVGAGRLDEDRVERLSPGSSRSLRLSVRGRM